MINLRNEKSYKKSNSIFTIDLNELRSLDNFFLNEKFIKVCISVILICSPVILRGRWMSLFILIYLGVFSYE